jgi:hypothetical protein
MNLMICVNGRFGCRSPSRRHAWLWGLLAVSALAGCQAPASRQTMPEYPTFPRLRHGIKAVFGENGNDHGGDLTGKGREYAAAFHDLRIDLTRIEFKWAIVEARRGTYDWSELDRLIGFLHENGVEPMLMLYCAPVWAMRGTPADEQLFIQRAEQNLHSVVWPKREFLPDFERFCETAARRYRGRAKLFEFWNEPDGMAGPIVYHDRSGKAVDVRYGGDAKEYTLWLKHMYAAVKRGNPDAVVAAGSLCVHDTRFIEAIYAAGGKDCCDAISLHPYATDGINVEWIMQCRRVMTMHGDWTKAVWLSEFGWNLGGDYDEKGECWPASATRQARIITATAPVIQSLPYITHAFWFTLNDWNTSQTGIDPTGTHRYGVMELAGRRRPAFDALRMVVAKTQQGSRPAEMPVPQVAPPSGPVDVDSDGRLRLTLIWQDPSPCLFSDDPRQRPGLSPFFLHLPGFKDGVQRLDVPFSGGRRPMPGHTVLWTALRNKVSFDRASLTPDNGGAAIPNTYEAVASVGFGPETKFAVTVPATAAHVATPPKIDGEVADWPSKWTIRDGQMKADFTWSKTHLFFACVIHDERHEQPHRGRDIWKGDCVQIAFDPLRDAVRGSQYDINDSEYALALTQDGPLLWRYICPENSYVGKVANAEVAVRRVGDDTCYELALPWTELGVVDPCEGRLIGTAIAACDWNGEKRTVYRFGDGVIGNKEPNRFASIRLVGDSQAQQK